MRDVAHEESKAVERHRASTSGGGTTALVAVIAGVVLFGATLVLLPEPVERLFAWIAYGSADRLDSLGPDAVAYVRLVHAILVAITVGWALTVLAVVAWFWRLDPRRAWLAVAVPAAAWFLLDTGYSLASGFWRNAVFNSAFLLALAVPLFLSRPVRGTEARP